MTKFGLAEVMDYVMKQFVTENRDSFSDAQAKMIDMLNTKEAYKYPSSKDAA